MLRKTDPKENHEELQALNEEINEIMNRAVEIFKRGIAIGASLEDTAYFIANFTNDSLRDICEEYGTKDIPGLIGAQIAWLGMTCSNFRKVMEADSVHDQVLEAIAKEDPDIDLSKVKVDMSGQGVIVKGLHDIDDIKEILGLEEDEQDEE